MQIAFYEGAQPTHVVPRLIEKMYSQKQRGVVWVPDALMYQALHDVTWTFSKTTFIPHGGKQDGIEPNEQPFWFTHTLENPNEASILVMVGCPLVEPSSIQRLGFVKVINVFDAPDETHDEQFQAYSQKKFETQWWINTTDGWKPKQTRSYAT